jgi:acyl-CoA hydrolase
MSEPRSGTVAATVVESTHFVLPHDANALGSVFGGTVCGWIDLACAVSAMRHCRRPVVTASMDALEFHAGIQVGHLAVVRAQVNAAFRSSLEIGCEVWGEDPLTGERRHTASAFLTFVALGSDGRPSPVPPLVCETPDEVARQEAAQRRRAFRLAQRGGHKDRTIPASPGR